jgi:hypothetical protein
MVQVDVFTRLKWDATLSASIILCSKYLQSQSRVGLSANRSFRTFCPVVPQRRVVRTIAATDFSIAGDGYGCWVQQRCCCCSKHPVASSYNLEVALFNPFAWFVRMPSFRSLPQHLPLTMCNVAVCGLCCTVTVVISPLLANIALDGMERLFGCETTDDRTIPPAKRKGKNKGISLIRYADDFVVMAPTRKALEEYVIPKLEEFLATRGLALNEAKTHIMRQEDGFNFLGFNIRRFGNTLLTQPQKEKVKRHLKRIKAMLDGNKQATTGHIIKMLNPVIRGWANDTTLRCSSTSFAEVSELNHSSLEPAMYDGVKDRYPCQQWFVGDVVKRSNNLIPPSITRRKKTP